MSTNEFDPPHPLKQICVQTFIEKTGMITSWMISLQLDDKKYRRSEKLSGCNRG